ncbi:ribonuclease H-like domain-containing protein [Tanacetum coccineum]
MKGIKREFSVARTPWQNGVAEKKNRTLIEVAKTMLVDSKLPTTFWAEAVNTACYVLNRVLVIKPHNKTPYELVHGRPPLIDFMKPFGCPVTILNTKDHLGKFDGKANERILLLGNGPDWLFTVDSLSISMNYDGHVCWAGNKTKGVAGTQRKHCLVVQAQKEKEPEARGDRLEMKATEVDDNEGLHDIKVGRHDQEVKKWHQKCIVGPSFDIVVPSTTI